MARSYAEIRARADELLPQYQNFPSKALSANNRTKRDTRHLLGNRDILEQYQNEPSRAFSAAKDQLQGALLAQKAGDGTAAAVASARESFNKARYGTAKHLEDRYSTPGIKVDAMNGGVTYTTPEAKAGAKARNQIWQQDRRNPEIAMQDLAAANSEAIRRGDMMMPQGAQRKYAQLQHQRAQLASDTRVPKAIKAQLDEKLAEQMLNLEANAPQRVPGWMKPLTGQEIMEQNTSYVDPNTFMPTQQGVPGAIPVMVGEDGTPMPHPVYQMQKEDQAAQVESEFKREEFNAKRYDEAVRRQDDLAEKEKEKTDLQHEYNDKTVELEDEYDDKVKTRAKELTAASDSENFDGTTAAKKELGDKEKWVQKHIPSNLRKFAPEQAETPSGQRGGEEIDSAPDQGNPDNRKERYALLQQRYDEATSRSERADIDDMMKEIKYAPPSGKWTPSMAREVLELDINADWGPRMQALILEATKYAKESDG